MTSFESDESPAEKFSSPDIASANSSEDALLAPVSRRVATIWNTVFAYIALALVLIRNLALVPLYFKFIGAEEYNAWLCTGAVLMQLTSVDFGLMGVLLQQVAAAYGRRDRKHLEQLIGTGLILAAGISLLMGVITAVVGPFLPRLVAMAPATGHRVAVCFLIVAFSNSFELMGFATGGLLKGLQRTFVPGLFLVISELVSLISTLYFLYTGWGLYSIAIGLVLRAFVELSGTAIGFVWIAGVRLKLRPHWSRAQVQSLWNFSAYQFMTQVAGRIKTSIDSFLIGVFLGKDVGGPYVLTTRAHDTVRMFAAGFGGAFSPALSHLHGEGNRHRFKEMIILLFKLQALTAAIGYGGVLALNRSFVFLWVGPDKYLGNAINMAAVFAAIAYQFSVAPFESVFARGGFAAIARVVWFEVVLRIVVMIGLLHVLGVLGTPIASLVCQCFGILLPFIWINAKTLPLSGMELRKLAISAAKLSAFPLIFALLLGLVLPPASTWTILVLEAVAFVAACLIATWLVDRPILLLVLRRGREPIAERLNT